jgi:hypothetical protein
MLKAKLLTIQGFALSKKASDPANTAIQPQQAVQAQQAERALPKRKSSVDEQSDKPPSGNAKSTRTTTWHSQASQMGHVPMSRGCA